MSRLYLRERPGTHCIGGWVGPGLVCKSAENLAPTGIRSPDRPARSESLYRLSYRGAYYHMVLEIMCDVCCRLEYKWKRQAFGSKG
jgi:hypothetical protein